MHKVYVYYVYNEDRDSHEVHGVFSSEAKFKEYCAKANLGYVGEDSGGERYYSEFVLNEKFLEFL